MRAALAIAAVSYRHLVAAKRTILLALLALLPAVVFYIGSSTMTETRAFRFFHDEGPLGVMALVVTPIIALVIATSALGEERRQNTMSFLVVRPIRRWAIVAAKGVAAWAAVFTVVGAGALALALAFGMRTGNWDTVMPSLAMAAINVVGYVALFMPLGYLFKRAILFGFIYVFVWESGLASVPGLSPLSVFRIGVSAYAGLLPESAGFLSEPLGNVAPGVGGALAKGIFLGALGVLAMTTVLRRRDLA